MTRYTNQIPEVVEMPGLVEFTDRIQSLVIGALIGAGIELALRNGADRLGLARLVDATITHVTAIIKDGQRPT